MPLTCHPGAEEKPSAQDPSAVILEADGRTVRVEVEIVRTPAARSKGLMFRRKLPAYRGMLFVFEKEEIQSFWMKNTYIPLDMIFINRKMQVVGVVERAEPMTTVSHRVAAPSIYVLEVHGGFAQANRIARGTRVKIESME